MDNFKQSLEWEELFQRVIIKAKDCPAIALCSNDHITADRIDDAAGNHVFDDYPEFWGITEQQGHQIRAVFQTQSVRRDPAFKEYIQNLIDTAMELKWREERQKS